MKRAFFVCALLVAFQFAHSDAPVSLAEKIALARRMADEAAEGKAESGRVVNGNFDFNAELAKFRASMRSEDVSLAVDMSAPDDDQPAQTSAPQASEETAAKADAQLSDKSQAAPAPTAAVAQASDGKTQPTEKQPQTAPDKSRAKHVVDTDKGFVNGYYVGRLGDGEDDVKRAVELAKKNSDEPRLYSYDGRLFAVVSDDYSAHSFAIRAVRGCEKLFDAYFANDDGKLSLARKVDLQFTGKKTDTPARVSVSKNGDVVLTFGWGKNLRLENFASAVAEGLLYKIAFESGGEAAVRRVPFWLKRAMSDLFEQTLRYGVPVEMAERGAKNPPSMPARVFEMDGVSEKSLSHPYWTFVAAMRAAKGDAARFAYAALAGERPQKLESRLRKCAPPSADFGLWWRCVLAGEIYARLGGVMSPARSAEEIARLAVLQVDSPDGRTGVPLDSLLGVSDTDALKLRALEIKVAFANINPVYHNSLVSLGKIYEAAAERDSEAFEKARAEFLSDFKNARAVSAEIARLMRD